jgi:hypothetical protein
MAMHRFKPTPREEWVGRVALGVLGGLCVFMGIWFWRWCAAGMDGVGDGEFGGALVLLAVLGGFFVLLGIVFVGMAFLPWADRGHGPPRGFVAVGRAFDWFWAVVAALLEW